MNFNDSLAINWQREPPAKSTAIEELILTSGLEFPEDYLAFLRWSNGGGGDSQTNADCYWLWSTEEVLQRNQDLGINEWLPDFFAIGADGGSEALVFDTRNWKLYKIQFVCLAEDEAMFFADNFTAFIETIA